MSKIILLLAGLAFLNSGIDAQTVTDYDGNLYHTVTIGSQEWLIENLNVTHFRNGDPIPEIQDSILWANQNVGAMCYFNNNTTNAAIYGGIYNWFSVNDSRGLAPTGWHIPTDIEWKILEIHLGLTKAEADASDWRGINEGAMLKEADTLHWRWPTGNTGTNESGFTALGGGWQLYTNVVGYTSFNNLTNTGQWWSSTELNSTKAWLRNLCVYKSGIYRFNVGKTQGVSVRCIKDAISTGINNLNSTHEIKISPNPVRSKLQVQIGPNSNYVTWRIMNSNGVKVLNGNITNLDEISINVNDLPAGFYILECKGDGSHYQKFIKL